MQQFGGLVKRLEVARHIAADPASVALLLADPVGDAEPDEGRLRVADEEGLEVAPPRRSGVGFVARVTATDRDGQSMHGEIRIEPATDPGCEARIVIDAPADASTSSIQRLATKFLATLADRARSRSYAA